MNRNIILLGILIFGVGLVSCGGTAANGQVAADSSQVKAMTFNIRYANPDDGPNYWDHRREAVVRMIRDQKPDIMGIQEGLVQQVLYLDSALTNYGYVGVGRDDGRTQGEYAAIFYDKNRFIAQEEGNFWLNETQDTARMGWDAVCVRIATWVKLQEKKTGKELMVFNTHFDHVGKIARRESAKLLLGKVELVGDSMPTLIMGDLNYPTSDSSLAPLVESATFVEVRKTAEVIPQGDTLPNRTFQGFRVKHEDAPHGTEYDAEPIDHIFAQGFRTLEYRVITNGYGVSFLSDHYPVVALLKY